MSVEPGISAETAKPHLNSLEEYPIDNNTIKKNESNGSRFSDKFVAGCGAAFINTTALFPINKLIFRQMVDGHNPQIAAGQMKKEGLSYLYRGILPPLIQKMITVSVMFGSYDQYRNWADRTFISQHPVSRLALAACLTGATEAVLTPLERVQMLLQDRRYHKDYKNTIDALIKMRKFGRKEYYRGLTCVLVRNCPSNILFFGLRGEIKQFLPDWQKLGTTQTNINSQKPQDDIISRNTLSSSSSPSSLNQDSRSSVKLFKSRNSMLNNFLSGAILGMFISTLFYPLSVVRTRMQTRAPGTKFLSIVEAFNAVYSERDKKFSRLFHGCLINVLRQFVSWGIINCSYEIILDMLHRND